MGRRWIEVLLVVVTAVGGIAGQVHGAQSAAAAGPVTPSPRDLAGMTYDAAHSQVVLFGGASSTAILNDTWTWNGSTWTQQTPAHSPSARTGVGMAYDAAHNQVVLFGGATSCCTLANDTWIWDGTDWTKRTPAHRPSERVYVQMTYDTALGEVLLFAGQNAAGPFDDTWAWNGTDWTQLTPAHSPPPSSGGEMVDDLAHQQVVLFSGCCAAASTWTWDGTDWTQRTPAHQPAFRFSASAAYDQATAQTVLFGGQTGDGTPQFHDTWVWDGTDWTERTPPHRPAARFDAPMAYDAANGTAVLFGGCSVFPCVTSDTWTWDGADWSVPYAASVDASPSSGPPGTVVQLSGAGYGANEKVRLSFVDSVSGTTPLGTITTDNTGSFTTSVTIPSTATPGKQKLAANAGASAQKAKHGFTVT
jgi:hypothetical protein